MKSKRNKSLVRTFFVIFTSILVAFFICAGAAILAYTQLNKRTAETTTDTPSESLTQAPSATPSRTADRGTLDLLQPPEKTSFLLIGFDQEEYLTDTIMLGCFERDTCKISLISIPRDTKYTFSQASASQLSKSGKHPPTDSIKINSIYAYSGKANGHTYLTSAVEEIFGIKIDYYAEINIDAFRTIVDAIGGVYMDIPKGGLYYSDPTQNLRIAIPEGRQLLDGEMAEGLVRFRDTYARGDLQRVEVQQEFMKQLVKQVLNRETIMSKAVSIATTLISYVKTDFSILDIPKYFKYISEINPDNMTTYTMPGYLDGNFYAPNKQEIKKFADEVFLSNATPSPSPTSTSTKTTPVPSANIKNMKIQILNGGAKDGSAKTAQNTLQNAGYTVSSIGNYNGSQTPETRIASRVRLGTQLSEYFTDPVYEVDANLTDDYDIVIIIGTAEVLK